jgi:hypothetical protein
MRTSLQLTCFHTGNDPVSDRFVSVFVFYLVNESLQLHCSSPILPLYLICDYNLFIFLRIPTTTPSYGTLRYPILTYPFIFYSSATSISLLKVYPPSSFHHTPSALISYLLSPHLTLPHSSYPHSPSPSPPLTLPHLLHCLPLSHTSQVWAVSYLSAISSKTFTLTC